MFELGKGIGQIFPWFFLLSGLWMKVDAAKSNCWSTSQNDTMQFIQHCPNKYNDFPPKTTDRFLSPFATDSVFTRPGKVLPLCSPGFVSRLVSALVSILGVYISCTDLPRCAQYNYKPNTGLVQSTRVSSMSFTVGTTSGIFSRVTELVSRPNPFSSEMVNLLRK